MFRVKDTSTVPAGGYFIYRDPDTGFLIRHPYYRQLRGMAHSYRELNNLPIGLLWDEQFDTAVCKEQPGICGDTRSEAEMTLPEKAAAFAGSMKNWALSGFKVLAHEEYQRRLDICRGTGESPRCEYWRGERNRFVACKKCGCSRLKLFLAGVVCPIGKW